MKLDILPIFQNERGMKNYLVTNFRRVQDLFAETDAYKTYVTNPWRLVGTTGEPAYQNGWAQYNAGDGYQDPTGFVKDIDSFVHLKGIIRSGSLGTVYTLPEGFRPPFHTRFVTPSSAGLASVDVLSNGNVQVGGYLSGGSNAYVFLSNIHFRTL